MSKAKVKYYVVWVGQNPGIYTSWQQCQEQIVGFPNAKYKSFKNKEEAEIAFNSSATKYINKSKKGVKRPEFEHFEKEIVKNSISVDAACSRNPGLMEYRGVYTFSKEEIFRIGPLDDGTNNVGEFLAIVHALALLKKNNDSKTTIYTDSRTALSWVRNKKVKTTLAQTKTNRNVHLLIQRALTWLHNNSYSNKILKWNTKKWGEIPADFGRK